jgi:hypothetical protein
MVHGRRARTRQGFGNSIRANTHANRHTSTRIVIFTTPAKHPSNILLPHTRSSSNWSTQRTSWIVPSGLKVSGAQNWGSWPLIPSGACCQRSPVQMNAVPLVVSACSTKFCCARVTEMSLLPPYRQPCPGVGKAERPGSPSAADVSSLGDRHAISLPWTADGGV